MCPLNQAVCWKLHRIKTVDNQQETKGCINILVGSSETIRLAFNNYKKLNDEIVLPPLKSGGGLIYYALY